MHDDAASLPDERLADLLRTGPFPDALRAAMEASGLTLSRIRHRLQSLGTPVSTATLSCWRSGRHQPSQTAALAALASLEGVLEVAPGALSSLLGPPRPRARWLRLAADAPGLTTLWPQPRGSDVGEAYRSVDSRWMSSLRCLHRHMRLEVDARGREHRVWMRQVVRAEQDGPDRAILTHLPDTPGSVPSLELRPPCRRGTVVENPRTGMLVAEVLFSRPLRRGDTAIFEAVLTHAEPRPSAEEFTVRQREPAGEYAMEVHFDPAALPATCYAFSTSSESGPESRRLLHTTDGCVHVIGTRTSPGVYGIRWE
ncbi:transcriptional regulator [Streptomyces sp. SID10815]|uniref:transcriptional regulator n=1 Tax=Streptomyces sp. SID10815 TaxID=2706027 RepID=UPI0013C781C1|nr:transcriptional regulator [Streptomyces sp. SID10815]NEA51986.1 transcriptional regulator [Streptomyces sp. SID10815]